jgi:hypothetical protein
LLNNLKIGKAPGIDNIPNEFLKYGGDIMIKSLSDLFTCRGFLEDLYRDAIPCKENIWSSILLSFRKAP